MRRLLLLVAAGAMLLALGIPAEAESGGTVTGTVTMELSGACITIEPESGSIHFGRQDFSQPGAVYGERVESPRAVIFYSCTEDYEVIYARGTDATGSPPAAWDLVAPGVLPPNGNPCNEGPDKYFQSVLGDAAVRSVYLDEASDQAIFSLAPMNQNMVLLVLTTACEGSTGAGDVMSMAWVFTAVAE